MVRASVERPAHQDPDRLRAAYEEADGDTQTVAARFPGVSTEGVRKALVRNDIHEPDSYTCYIKLLEKMTVEEFDHTVGGDDA